MQHVKVDISDDVSDYSLYTPEMITSQAEVKEGDILIINTGYHKYGWDQPDVHNPDAQGGVENKEQVEGNSQWENQQQQIRRIPEARKRVGSERLPAQNQMTPQRHLSPGRQRVANEERIGPVGDAQVRVLAVGAIEKTVRCNAQRPKVNHCQRQQ